MKRKREKVRQRLVESSTDRQIEIKQPTFRKKPQTDRKKLREKVRQTESNQQNKSNRY